MDRAALEWTCFPRVATRTPRLNAQSVGVAREFGLATLRRWMVADRTDDIAIVLSELLTNALRHGADQPGRPVRLALVQPAGFVLVVVADPGRQVPVLKEPDYLAESGRGLHVINALSDSWGCTTPTDAGKAVWALFAVHFTEPRPDPGWLLRASRAQSGRRRICERSQAAQPVRPGWLGSLTRPGSPGALGGLAAARLARRAG